MALPSDKKIRTFIEDFLEQDVRDNGEVTATVRVLRTQLALEYDLDEEELKREKKDVIKGIAQEVADSVMVKKEEEAEVGESSKSKEASPNYDSESSLEDSDQEDSTKPSSSKKRKRSSSGVKREASSSSSKGEGSSKDKSNGSSSSSGNKDKDEVERLKKYVNACGVKKPYKNWFPEQGATTPKLQVKALRSLLSELGMGEGRLSMGKAAEIKQKREMEKELQAIGAAIGSDEEELKKGRTTRNRKSRRNEDDDSDEEDGFEEEEKGSSPGGRRSPRQIKKKRGFANDLADFANDLNSD